jgi:hypothetical protein
LSSSASGARAFLQRAGERRQGLLARGGALVLQRLDTHAEELQRVARVLGVEGPHPPLQELRVVVTTMTHRQIERGAADDACLLLRIRFMPRTQAWRPRKEGAVRGALPLTRLNVVARSLTNWAEPNKAQHKVSVCHCKKLCAKARRGSKRAAD